MGIMQTISNEFHQAIHTDDHVSGSLKAGACGTGVVLVAATLGLAPVTLPVLAIGAASGAICRLVRRKFD